MNLQKLRYSIDWITESNVTTIQRAHLDALLEIAEAAIAWDKRDVHGYAIDTRPEACALSKALQKLEDIK